jgi:hypothetical protein
VSGRGRHARDDDLFARGWHETLRVAVSDLCWLLSRGYAESSALKLVGDRHGLRKRQRTAVLRSACSDEAAAGRNERKVEPANVAGHPLALDGLNCLITVESALAGGIVLKGRDCAHRDLASVHGSYRRVATTKRAINALSEAIARMHPASVTWLLDRPVSNSGRLRRMLEAFAQARDWTWDVRLDNNPDRILVDLGGVVASSDAWILDACNAWVDLPGAVIAAGDIESPWIVDLG